MKFVAEPDVLVRREIRAGAIVLAVVVPLTVGLAAWWWPHDWMRVAGILALALMPICVWLGSWRLACDDDTITIGAFFRRRVRWRDVDRIVAGRLAHDPVVVIVCRSRWRGYVRIRFRHWGPALLRVLRSHAPPGTYRISLADEEALWGRGVPKRIGRRLRIRAAPGAAYRDPARASVSISLSRPLAGEHHHRARGGIAASLAVASIALAWGLAGTGWNYLAIACAIALGVSALRSWSFVRWHAQIRAGLRQWLGDVVDVDRRGVLTSRDRLCRVRQLPADLDDPWRGLHCHYERLAPDGATVSSEPRSSFDLGLPAEMRAPSMRELARVLEVRIEPAIAFVVIEHGPDGALLYRFDDRGRAIGDTFHEDAAAARAQVAREATIDRWHEIDPRADPWSLARIASAGRADADVL